MIMYILLIVNSDVAKNFCIKNLDSRCCVIWHFLRGSQSKAEIDITFYSQVPALHMVDIQRNHHQIV